MEWFFNRGAKKVCKEGIVGVYETPTSIAMVYVVPSDTQITVKAQYFEAGEDLTRKQTVLKKFVAEHELQGVPCTFVLGLGDYSLNLVEAPTVPKAEVSKAVSWTLKDRVSFPIEEAIIDTFELPFTRASDNTSMLYAAVVQKRVVSRIETFVNESGLELKFIDIPELTLKNISDKSPEQEKGCAFINLHPTGGKLILTKNESLCVTRSFNLDLDDLTTEEAPAILETLSLEIQRSFDYTNSLFKKTIPSVLVLAPTTLDKFVIESSIKSSLGVEVFYLKLADYFVFENSLEEGDEPEFLFALGATMRKKEVVNATTD